jgi:valyl-tRNA synthetase
MSAMRRMAGHSKSQGTFFLPRAGLEPSEELMSKIFPFVTEELIQKMTTERKSTAVMFLKALKRFRSIIIQDVAELMMQGQKHVIFNTEPFKSKDFVKYMAELKAYVAAAKDPNDTRIETVVPGLTDTMKNHYSSLKGEIANTSTRITSQIASSATDVKSHINSLCAHVGLFGNSESIPTAILPDAEPQPTNAPIIEIERQLTSSSLTEPLIPTIVLECNHIFLGIFDFS